MRVALISAYYPSHGGGMELACEELAQVLLSAQIEVIWIAQRDKSYREEHGIYLPVPGTDLVYDISGVPMPLPMPWAAPRISREIGKADVVAIAEANFALSVLAYWLATVHRKKILLIQHVGKPSTVSRLAKAVMAIGEKAFVRPMVRGADAVVCVSPVVSGYFSSLKTRARLLTIGHGIDTVVFRPSRTAIERRQDRSRLGLPEKRKLACYLGRLTESKGLEVIREMAQTRPDWDFAIAGSGPINPNEWALSNVRFLGQLDRENAARLLRASEVTILPSQSESFSLVVREALASDCKVICSEQILETDPGLEPYLATESIDLAKPSETAKRLAPTLDRLDEFSIDGARSYIERVCSSKSVGARYVQLIRNLATSPGYPRR